MDAYRRNAGSTERLVIERSPSPLRVALSYLALATVLLLIPACYLTYWGGIEKGVPRDPQPVGQSDTCVVDGDQSSWSSTGGDPLSSARKSSGADGLFLRAMAPILWLALLHPLVAQLSLRWAARRPVELDKEAVSNLSIDAFTMLDDAHWAGIVTKPPHLVGVVGGPAAALPENAKRKAPRKIFVWPEYQPLSLMWLSLLSVAWAEVLPRLVFLVAVFLYSFLLVFRIGNGVSLRSRTVVAPRGVLRQWHIALVLGRHRVVEGERAVALLDEAGPQLTLRTALGQNQLTLRFAAAWIRQLSSTQSKRSKQPKRERPLPDEGERSSGTSRKRPQR